MALMQSAGDFDRSRRAIAAHRMQPDAFHDHRAELVQVQELCVFDAVTESAGRDHHRVWQRHCADLDGQIHFALRIPHFGFCNFSL